MTAASATPIGGSAPKLRLVLAGLMTVMALAVIDSNIVNTSLPRIVGDFGGMAQMAWAVTAFLLASTVSAPLYGKLSDLYGRRRLMTVSIGVFLAGSILCGVASSMLQLILCRAVQGLGAGGLVTMVQAIIGDLVAPAQRARYQTLFTTVFALSSLAGPLIGGALTTYLTWRWIFFINLPIGGVALALLMASLPASIVSRRPRIDLLGAGLLAVATTAFLMAVGSGVPHQDRAVGLALGAVAVVGFVLFIGQEQRAVEPILDLGLFANRTFTIGVCATVTMSFAMIAALLLLPLYLQVVDRRTPVEAAIIVTPQMIGIVLSSFVGARLATAVGDVARLLAVGVLLETLGLWGAVAATGYDAPLWMFSGIAFVLGMGMGIGMPNAVTIVQNAVRRDQLGVATGAISFFRSLGGAAGVALSGTVVTFVLRDRIGRARPGEVAQRLIDRGMASFHDLDLAQQAAFLHAYRLAIAAAFALCALFITGALAVVTILPRSASVGEPE